MSLRRLFEQARARLSLNDSHKRTCLCTTAKRDSFYDDLPASVHRSNDRQSTDFYGFARSDKPRRILRHTNIEESDGDDDSSITERLRRATSQSPANIPMIVVVSFNPDSKGLQKRQIEIQRGFPVNAQFIQNEWLFVKTADNDEGFVPYVCCRPMLRRQSLKPSLIDMEQSYKPYDFDSSKSPSTSNPTFTPPSNKKLSLPSTLGSQSYLFQNSSCKKRQDVTSSSCGGDSGFSDCESSSHHHSQYRTADILTSQYARSSNIRSLRVSSNGWKQNGLTVEDASLKKANRINCSYTNLSRSEGGQRVRSQLSISSNSAFTHFVKRNINSQQEQESNQRQSSRLLYHRSEVSPSSSSISHLNRPCYSYDETKKCPSTTSSPYIRRTPFTRRSLPHHLQPVPKKNLRPILASSPDPFQTIKSDKKEQQLRHVVLAEPSTVIALPSQSTIQRQFSDLSLNQIENDSLIPSSSSHNTRNRPSLSCSSTSSSSSSPDDNSTAFAHINMKSSRYNLVHRDESIPCISNSYTTANSSSFIHNVSITV